MSDFGVEHELSALATGAQSSFSIYWTRFARLVPQPTLDLLVLGETGRNSHGPNPPVCSLDRTNPANIMSAQITSSSPLPELPSEIWLNIFRIATFIPRETDVSATTVEPGLFCSYDEYQADAFEAVLPLRRSIVLVSRRFYQIGTVVLYTTFHVATFVKNSHRRVSLFSDLLVSRPELGQFIRRLSLWSDWDEEENDRIINRCPNMIIFSSRRRDRDRLCFGPWWRGGGLPKTVRSFDANVRHLSPSSVVKLLETLPHLEILHLWDLETDVVPLPPICLPALRILSVQRTYARDDKSTKCILSTIQLPRLTALVSSGELIGKPLVFPPAVWQGLEYYKPEDELPIGLRSDYFRNLRHLHLILSSEGLETYLECFPFHQLECLTLSAPTINGSDKWKPMVKPVVGLPLNVTAMPKLKLVQLVWPYDGIYMYYCLRLNGGEEKDRFIRYFDTLTVKFEQRGVLFVETNNREICPGFQPIRDVLNVCKQS